MESGDVFTLEERARRAAGRFHMSRQPVVLEFAGVPKAGKTTTLSHVERFLKHCGFRVKTVVERASVCPIRDKKAAIFNVWTACTTLAQVLENTQPPPRPPHPDAQCADQPDVLFLDRGLFDAVNWFGVMERMGRISQFERETVERFLLMSDWTRRISGVVVMTTSPREALKRETDMLPIEQPTGGSIMNSSMLETVLTSVKATVRRLKDDFTILEVDTSKDGLRETIRNVSEFAVQLIEKQLEERILHIGADELSPVFRNEVCIDRRQAEKLVDLFATEGSFESRETVEANGAVVQALPIVIVRNRSGHVLQLKRREQHRENPLNDRVVIWAGGHVREEDGENGASLIHCAVRELKEELRLSIDCDTLRLLGAVWVRAAASPGIRDKTRQHVAIVYEWKAPADDVAVALSRAEFYERRGNSLSGSFVNAQELATNIDNDIVREPWSVEIVRQLLPDVSRELTNPKML